MEKTADVQVKARDAASWLLARGRSSATSAELADLLGVPVNQVRQRLNAPARRGEWVCPVRGLWVPVPPEYRLWGAPPGVDLVNVMMSHLGVGYYVGWLSAAAQLGISHQAPQVFQVATTSTVDDRTVGRTRFQFARRAAALDLPTTQLVTRTGYARFATAELVAFDIATDPDFCGGLDNAATVIVELAENSLLDGNRLAGLSAKFPAASGRRIGFILDNHSDADVDLNPLHKAVARAIVTPSRLNPSGMPTGAVDDRWQIFINRELEPDT